MVLYQQIIIPTKDRETVGCLPGAMVFPGPWRWAHHLLAKLAKIPGIEADLISCNSLLGGCPWDMALHEPWLGLAWFGLVWGLALMDKLVNLKSTRWMMAGEKK